MRLCIFEDDRVSLLEPLTLTRPAFDLWCGAAPLWQRQQRVFAAREVGALVRADLVELCRLAHADFAVNDADWLHRGKAVLINARWLPPYSPIQDVATPRVGLVDDQVAYAVTPEGLDVQPETVDDWLAVWRRDLPSCPAGGAMLDYPWELVEHNPESLRHDVDFFGHQAAHPATVLGPADQLRVHPEAVVEPFTLADTRNGPVLIDAGAVVQSFSRLEGPCYVGRDSWVVGAKLRGGTIGPCCRVGGEVEASIILGHTNKYHDGFLGHAYLGEWVNIGAGTQVSDLRNDYGQVRVLLHGERLGTGLTKVGVFLGDHSKTGLGTLLNSGTVVGAFCNLLPSGTFLPPAIPSFCNARYGQLQERTDLRQILQTSATVMRRRGQELTGAHVDFIFNLYDATAEERRRMLRDSELRRLRKSM